ncbi:winged helix-turn-helix domain-containing protein [Candidatus Nitrosotenuis cloacae]|uniref:winged helix-turn-helix domain-containing protein n=1 Tax=Candidatus Nitrosotenuis cloacae TaxID=1603555 RepID=UPI00227E3467|nr:winged helix-turn-helix domain-containing protein [Candidatus Nitrosotenuis cloacae]
MVSKIYRDRIYIIKDVITLLIEYGELNQTALFSYSGLNLKKHKKILDDLESHGFISRSTLQDGKRTITMYRATTKGLEFCRTIIEPYEELFPRKSASDTNLGLLIFV